MRDDTIIRQYILKYLVVVCVIAILKVLLHEIFPEMYTIESTGQGWSKSEATFFRLYEANFFNVIIAVFMAVDLNRINKNQLIVPFLTIVSASVGFFFFSIVIVNNVFKNDTKI